MSPCCYNAPPWFGEGLHLRGDQYEEFSREGMSLSPCCNNAPPWSGEGLDPRDKAAGGHKLRLPTQDTQARK